MRRLPIDGLRPPAPPASPLVEATLALVQDMVRRRYGDWSGDWAGFSQAALNGLFTREDVAALEAKILASGHRFAWSAAISPAERPEAYVAAEGLGDAADFSFEHPDAVVEGPDAEGRILCGVGDNVVRHAGNATGTARYIRSNARVLSYLSEGVPPGTIAVIDDSGGTLTAPIIEQFAGVICAGGSVRSHLGILTREYGIPCLMNAKVKGIRDGDQVEIETSAAAKTTEDYQAGREQVGRVWRRSAEAAR